MMLRKLLNRFVRPLRPLEENLIRSVAGHFDAATRDLLAKQVAQINLVQRHDDDKEVNFYSIKKGKPAFDEMSLFPLREERALATVRFKTAAKIYGATLWVVHGHLFSLEFDASPKKLRDEAVEIQQVKILANPMDASH